MAFLCIKNIKVRGISACIPKRIEENKVIPVFRDDNEASRVIAQTGIERKRVTDADTCASDLYGKAAEVLLNDLGWSKDSIEVLVVVSLSPDYTEPPTACIMQHRLGLPESCLTIDINQGCPGWVDGLISLSSILSASGIKRGLLLNGDVSTKLSSPLDKECRPLFGDAGIATALEFSEGCAPLLFEVGTKGSQFKAIWRKAGGVREPLTAESLEMKCYGENLCHRDIDCVMEGMDVFAFGITVAPKSVKDLCDHFDIAMESVDKFVFHQANQYMNNKIRRKLKLPEEKVPMSLKDFGNTSSASIPLTIVSQCRDQYASSRLATVACAFGVGLAWGSVWFETDKICIPELIEY